MIVCPECGAKTRVVGNHDKSKFLKHENWRYRQCTQCLLRFCTIELQREELLKYDPDSKR